MSVMNLKFLAWQRKINQFTGFAIDSDRKSLNVLKSTGILQMKRRLMYEVPGHLRSEVLRVFSQAVKKIKICIIFTEINLLLESL